ncbi:MAG: DNA cytosine methyltransferase [Bryobacterales bacterium]|nr:DNA cytosine methyltransferase [Bryobacterales bacterium]
MDRQFQQRLKSSEVMQTRQPFFEFFAGGGMARLGLGNDWQCTFSNEWCEKKASAYRAAHGGEELRVCDVAELTLDDLPGVPFLVWASFPCQDLSLAGNGAGLEGNRSGTYKPFWKLIRGMVRRGRQPQLIVLENVVGTLTSHDGKDFAHIVSALVEERYRVGALVMDAVRFLPQSRPRLFIIGVHADTIVPSALMQPQSSEPWHTKSLRSAVQRLPEQLQDAWAWWSVPLPSEPVPSFGSLIEEEPTRIEWHTKAQTDHIINLMAPLHLEKLKKAQLLGKRIVGTVYRRTRPNENGVKAQRAEIRFDQISGCLRTPVGGSSRQTIVVVEGRQIRSRLLSPREAARLMGVPDDYPLPEKYNDAYHLFGDGLAVPVVRWLSTTLLTPIATASRVMIAA